MNKHDGPEKRSVRRYRVNCISIFYKRPILLGISTSKPSRPCGVGDLSSRGLKFYTPFKLKSGMMLDVAFECAVNSGLVDTGPPVKARVIWQEWSTRRQGYRTGVVFIHLREVERDAILKMLDSAVAFDSRHHVDYEGSW